jgi:hypothetical protein
MPPPPPTAINVSAACAGSAAASTPANAIAPARIIVLAFMTLFPLASTEAQLPLDGHKAPNMNVSSDKLVIPRT